MHIKKLGLAASAAASAALFSVMPASASEISVHPGDSLWKISHSHHISLHSLEAANPNVDPMNLRIGSVLKMPASSSKSVHAKASTSVRAKASASVDNNSVYWLAHLIHAEADGEPYQAQLAVGDVVLHRVQSSQYPNTVPGVVFQISDGHYQFTCVENQYIYTAPTAQNYQAARDVLAKNVDVVPGADVFYNPAQTPGTSWVRKQPMVASIGSFIFAK